MHARCAPVPVVLCPDSRATHSRTCVPQKAVATNRKPWDPTPLRPWPAAVKGQVCVTDEPWARDEEILDLELTPRGFRDEPFVDGVFAP